MRLASANKRINAAGAEVIAVSVDDDERQAAMYARWPTPNVLYVSDPGGEDYLQPLELYNAAERGGIALPSVLVIDDAGDEVFGYRGRDFADRTHDDDVFDALEGLGLGPIDAPGGGPVVADVDVNQKGAFQPALLASYFAGNRFGAVAIGGRATGDEAKNLAREHRKMSEAILEAWNHIKPN